MSKIKINDQAEAVFQLQSYQAAPTITGVDVANLKCFADDGGLFIELSRLQKGTSQEFKGFEARQINYSEMDPGVIKAFHLHRHQTDVWFVPPADKMLVILKDLRSGYETSDVESVMDGDLEPFILAYLRQQSR